MNLVKIILLVLILVFTNFKTLYADNHDTMEEVEEDVPLNDPFVGDSSLTGGSEVLTNNPEEARNEMSLYKFKLVGVMKASNDEGFVSLINANGEIISIGLFEELSPGVKLVALNNNEAVFEKNGNSYLAINFKNQIIERAK